MAKLAATIVTRKKTKVDNWEIIFVSKSIWKY